MQIQAMLLMLAEKFLTTIENEKLKEMLAMTAVAKMWVYDSKIEMAENALRKGYSIKVISEITGLDEKTILKLHKELQKENVTENTN